MNFPHFFQQCQVIYITTKYIVAEQKMLETFGTDRNMANNSASQKKFRFFK